MAVFTSMLVRNYFENLLSGQCGTLIKNRNMAQTLEPALHLPLTSIHSFNRFSAYDMYLINPYYFHFCVHKCC